MFTRKNKIKIISEFSGSSDDSKSTADEVNDDNKGGKQLSTTINSNQLQFQLKAQLGPEVSTGLQMIGQDGELGDVEIGNGKFNQVDLLKRPASSVSMRGNNENGNNEGNNEINDNASETTNADSSDGKEARTILAALIYVGDVNGKNQEANGGKLAHGRILAQSHKTFGQDFMVIPVHRAGEELQKFDVDQE
jgi:hypothetical protein